MRATVERRSAAFAPGHVTGAFAPGTSARDPRARGSVGIGLVLEAGVRAEARWRPSRRPRVSIVADAPHPLGISHDVAARLLARRPGELTVRLSHQLPIGQGFGMSAAGALSTALAVAPLVGASRSRAIATAHLADLFGGGGLGGVAAILGGGLERRLAAGIPPFGRVVRRTVTDPVLVAVVGEPIPSPRVLTDPRALARIAAAYGAIGLGGGAPTMERFWTESERFSDRVDLAPRPVRDAVRAVRRRGGRAAQAMFGRSFFATLPSGPRRSELLGWLEGRGIRAVELRVPRVGARRVRPSARPFGE